MLTIITGASGAGKSAVAQILENDYGCKELVSTTTRRMRPGEQQGVSYHFVSNEKFDEMIKKDMFVEYEEYSQSRFYGTSKEVVKEALQSSKNYCVVITPGGLRAIKDYAKQLNCEDKIFSINIQASLGNRVSRYIERCGINRFNFDDMNEIFARVNRDFGMFLGIEKEVEKTYENNQSGQLKDIAAEVASDIEKKFRCVLDIDRLEDLEYEGDY